MLKKKEKNTSQPFLTVCLSTGAAVVLVNDWTPVTHDTCLHTRASTRSLGTLHAGHQVQKNVGVVSLFIRGHEGYIVLAPSVS